MIPVPENMTDAGVHVPLTKLKPTTLMVSVTAPRPRLVGQAPPRPYGPRLMFRQLVQVAGAALGFVTITLRLPMAAPLVTESRTSGGSASNDVVVAVTPVPETVTMLPGTKPVPMMDTGTFTRRGRWTQARRS